MEELITDVYIPVTTTLKYRDGFDEASVKSNPERTIDNVYENLLIIASRIMKIIEQKKLDAL